MNAGYLRSPINGDQTNGPRLGDEGCSLNQHSLAGGIDRLELNANFTLQGTDVFHFELNGGRVVDLHEQAGIGQSRRSNGEFRLQPFHVPCGQVRVVQVATQTSDSVPSEVASCDADFDLHAVDEHLVGDFTQVHVSVELKAQTVKVVPFKHHRFTSGANDIARFEIFHLPYQLKG